MSNHTELSDRISRYVRGELPDEEAEQFEELYFQDEELARLVEAEQVLRQAPDLLGSKLGRSGEISAGSLWHGWSGARAYAYAASIMVLAAGAGLVWLGSDNRTLRQQNARLHAVSVHPSVADGMVRLSAVRGGSSEAPAFTVELPGAVDRFVTLMLPVPSTDADSADSADSAGAATVRLSRRDGGGVVWAREIEAGALSSPLVLVNLPGGAIEPGDYVIALQRHRGAAEPITLAEYAFRVASK